MTQQTQQQNVITTERRRLAPHIERVNGRDIREGFREIFDRAASRYALGKIDGPEFAEIVNELIRDAAGTAAGQDRETDAREPWATMPVDGSGRLGSAERVVFGVIGAGCVAVLLMVAWLLGTFGSNPDAPDRPVPPVTVVGTPAGAGEPDRDAARELIMQGAYLSWQAYQECGQGPEACERVLWEVNNNPYGVRFFEDGSAFVPGRENY
jgi:hypothetical protein